MRNYITSYSPRHFFLQLAETKNSKAYSLTSPSQVLQPSLQQPHLYSLRQTARYNSVLTELKA